MSAYFHVAVRLVLIAIQLVVAAFYAFYAVMMWRPFIEGPLGGKLLIFTLVFWPVLAIVVARTPARNASTGATSVIALLTAFQLFIVVGIAIAAS